MDMNKIKQNNNSIQKCDNKRIFKRIFKKNNKNVQFSKIVQKKKFDTISTQAEAT